MWTGDRPDRASTINIQSKLRTFPILCTNDSLQCSLVANGNSVCTQSDMYAYTHILHNIENLVGRNTLKKL
jgi:hypothetical protein